MAKKQVLLLLWLLIIAICMMAGDGGTSTAGTRRRSRPASLSQYCESWRANVELHNIRGFPAVPGECADYVGRYMTSLQYDGDVQRAAEEAALFLAGKFKAGEDGKDAWVFDVDDTLLSSLPYYQNHHFGAVLWCGGSNPDRPSLEQWMKEGEAPALQHILDLYDDIKGRGLKVFLISSRGEEMRQTTVDNLIKAGYSGWAELILKCKDENYEGVEEYKVAQRKKLVDQGYRLWGIVGDQWSSIAGDPSAQRTFKLPNPMYYVS